MYKIKRFSKRGLAIVGSTALGSAVGGAYGALKDPEKGYNKTLKMLKEDAEFDEKEYKELLKLKEKGKLKKVVDDDGNEDYYDPEGNYSLSLNETKEDMDSNKSKYEDWKSNKDSSLKKVRRENINNGLLNGGIIGAAVGGLATRKKSK